MPGILDFLTALTLCTLIIAPIIFLVAVFGSSGAYVVNWYAAGGLGCCTILLGWWGYFHVRGPDIGFNA